MFVWLLEHADRMSSFSPVIFAVAVYTSRVQAVGVKPAPWPSTKSTAPAPTMLWFTTNCGQ